jgi:hypothetical protein
MAEKYFNRQEAEELLPIIQPQVEQARQQKQRLEGLKAELAGATSRIMLLGGSFPSYAELAGKKAEHDKAAAKLVELVDKIQQTGCVIKDLDMGLVDFPSLLRGEEVYLCWKLGEERIGFWHGMEEGFAGRKPLDDSKPAEPRPPSGRVQ